MVSFLCIEIVKQIVKVYVTLFTAFVKMNAIKMTLWKIFKQERFFLVCADIKAYYIVYYMPKLVFF